MELSNLSREDISILIVGHLTSSLTDEENIILEQWISESAENRNEFNNMKNAWILFGKTNSPIPDVDKSWIKVKRNLNAKKDKNLVSKNNNKKTFKYVKLAASWIVFLALGSTITFMFNNKPQIEKDKALIKFSTPLGARSTLEMPDGTKIWLNAGTTITCDESYGQETRTLNLTGEAFFDVTKDKLHPFIVETPEMKIHALGTKFNVKAYPEERIISTVLEEGSINIVINEKNKGNESILLNPREKLVYYKNENNPESNNERLEEYVFELKPQESRKIELPEASVIENIKTEIYTSWKDERWVIESETLGKLAPVLERRYHIKILFMDKDLKDYRFSGIIENETVSQVFDAMQFTAPLNYDINKDTIKLTINKFLRDEFLKITTQN